MPFNQFETLNLIENEQTQHTKYWGKYIYFYDVCAYYEFDAKFGKTCVKT